jgi:hypothetical protein
MKTPAREGPAGAKNTLLPDGEKEGPGAQQREDEGEIKPPASFQVRFAHPLA